MRYDLTVQNNKKIGLFTDIHFGVGKDSQMRLNQTRKCFEWIIKQFIKNDVQYVIFCGDLFDSRFAINVQTLNCAVQCVQKLAVSFQKVFMIIGNHDTYYKNSNNTNSINFLSKLSYSDNIVIIQDDPYFIRMGGSTLGLYPWGYEVKNLKQIDHYQPVDFGFGHFEINGIQQGITISSGATDHYKDLRALGTNIFSGHYHNSKRYKNGDCTVYMLGDPLQLNWGQFDKQKFIYTLDCEKFEFIPIINNVNSTFNKIYYSQMQSKKYDQLALKKKVNGNFVKFVIDVKYQFENVLQYTDIIKQYKPLTLEIQYIISLTSDIILQSTDQLIKSNSKDTKTYLMEYVEKVYNQVKQLDDNIQLDVLNQLTKQYYDKSLLSQSQRKQKQLQV